MAYGRMTKVLQIKTVQLQSVIGHFPIGHSALDRLREKSCSDFFLGRRIVRLAALDVAALLDEVADLVGRDGELALRANVQSGRDQEVVAPPLVLRRYGFTSLWYGHNGLPRWTAQALWWGKISIIGTAALFSSPTWRIVAPRVR